MLHIQRPFCSTHLGVTRAIKLVARVDAQAWTVSPRELMLFLNCAGFSGCE